MPKTNLIYHIVILLYPNIIVPTYIHKGISILYIYGRLTYYKINIKFKCKGYIIKCVAHSLPTPVLPDYLLFEESQSVCFMSLIYLDTIYQVKSSS